MFVFFFKQKTAYEMRISDWSSDVCSSDLWKASLRHPALLRSARVTKQSRFARKNVPTPPYSLIDWPMFESRAFVAFDLFSCLPIAEARSDGASIQDRTGPLAAKRSEENTSELQSLMRISYAVFFLKKKTKKHKST